MRIPTSAGRRLSLLGKFGVLSAVLIALIGVVLGRSMQTLIHDRAIDNARRSAMLVSRVGVQAHVTKRELRRGLRPESAAMLDEAVTTKDAVGRQIEGVTIWNRRLDTVYSEDRRPSRERPLDDDVRTALAGSLAGRIETRVVAPPDGRGDAPRLLDVYVPVEFPDSPRPDGVVRLTQPYGPIAAAVASDTRWLYGILAGCLIVMYGLLFGLVSKASTTLRRQAQENAHQAMHDALTGLPNRTLFRDRVAQSVAASRRGRTGFALMLIDLDRFKEINDTLGHHNGDVFLRQIGPRLESVLREMDSIARLGGDEFGILLPGVTEGEAAGVVAAKLRTALERPVLLNDLRLNVEASVGISLFPEHGDDVDTLIQRADVAMYVAKESHTGYEVYNAESDQYTPRRLAMPAELRHAIDEGQLVLHYQPVADLRTGRVEGVEALVRWQHPEHGLLPPDDFIPLAEHTGLIVPLTMVVLDEALRQCAEWREEGVDLKVSVNLSARNLLDTGLPDAVSDLLARYRLGPACLRLELTENTIMADPKRALDVLERLRAIGVGLAIDDFGAGYSSLGYLKRLPVDELKIDRSFVINMESNENDAVIVRSTIDLSRNLGLTVVAEGVENVEVWHRLVELGCTLAQGYFLTRALPADQLLAWLRASGLAPAAKPASGDPAFVQRALPSTGS
jgi:diguanylate cyclase (GGDEF)-like protein